MTFEKSPYRVSLMTEIAAVKWNGLTSVDLFGGIGGTCTGFRMAGFRVLLANEFAPSAQENYRANMRSDTILDDRDVHDVTAADVLAKIKLKPGELSVLTGSPPCTVFSMSGTQKQSRGIGKDREYAHGARQKDEDLFFEFVRLRDGLMPKAFVAENVSGLVKGVAKGYFLDILKKLKRGYRVEARMLDAQWLGVPQRRQRLIFVGVRDDLGLDPAFPDPMPWRYSVREALAHPPPGHVVEPETDVGTHAIAAEYDRLNPGGQSQKYFNLFRAPLSEPVQTLTASGGMNAGIACAMHPTERRKFAVWELLRLSGFPDDFKMVGTYAERYRGIGNCVPPVMARAVAETLRNRVLLPARAAGRSTATRSGRSKVRAESPPATAAEASPRPRSRRRTAAAPTDVA